MPGVFGWARYVVCEGDVSELSECGRERETMREK